MEPRADPVRERIERAAEGLVYSSESDRPFEFRRFPAVAIPVGAALGHGARLARGCARR